MAGAMMIGPAHADVQPMGKLACAYYAAMTVSMFRFEHMAISFVAENLAQHQSSSFDTEEKMLDHLVFQDATTPLGGTESHIAAATLQGLPVDVRHMIAGNLLAFAKSHRNEKIPFTTIGDSVMAHCQAGVLDFLSDPSPSLNHPHAGVSTYQWELDTGNDED